MVGSFVGGGVGSVVVGPNVGIGVVGISVGPTVGIVDGLLDGVCVG